MAAYSLGNPNVTLVRPRKVRDATFCHCRASQLQWRMENDPGPVDVVRRRLPCIVRQRVGVAMTAPTDDP
jgi:hypothetical protein